MEAKLAAQHRSVVDENAALLEDLVAIVRELHPIGRQTIWPAELIGYIAQRQNWKCTHCGGERLIPLSQVTPHLAFEERRTRSVAGAGVLREA
jgi:hypothetical protein